MMLMVEKIMCIEKCLYVALRRKRGLRKIFIDEGFTVGAPAIVKNTQFSLTLKSAKPFIMFQTPTPHLYNIIAFANRKKKLFFILSNGFTRFHNEEDFFSVEKSAKAYQSGGKCF